MHKSLCVEIRLYSSLSVWRSDYIQVSLCGDQTIPHSVCVEIKLYPSLCVWRLDYTKVSVCGDQTIPNSFCCVKVRLYPSLSMWRSDYAQVSLLCCYQATPKSLSAVGNQTTPKSLCCWKLNYTQVSLLLEIRPYPSLSAVGDQTIPKSLCCVRSRLYQSLICSRVVQSGCWRTWVGDLNSVCVRQTGVSPFQRIFIPSSVESGACSPEIILRIFFLTIVFSFCPVVKSFV